MKKKTLLISILFILLPAILLSESFECTYMDGNVEFSENSRWKNLEPGVVLTSENSVKLTSDSIVTFKIATRSITISTQGIYLLGDLSREIGERQRVTVFDSFLSKLKTILNPEVEKQSQALGVRAAEAETPGFEWTDADEDDFDMALEYIEDGILDEAEYILEDLVMFGNPGKTDEYRFYLAYILMLQSRTGEAIKELNLIETPQYYPFYEGYIIMKGRLAFESLDDGKAREAWTLYLEEFPEGSAVNEAEQYLSSFR